MISSVLYGCETWLLRQSKKHSLEIEGVRGHIVAVGYRILHNNESHNLYDDEIKDNEMSGK
jgi:hypothetical protein